MEHSSAGSLRANALDASGRPVNTRIVTTSPTRLRERVCAATLPRRALLGIFVLGLAGTGAELLLLEHTETFWQWLPLILIALTFGVLILQCIIQRAAIVRAFQVTMFLLMAGGVIGLGLHFNGNREFELEMHPGQTGMKLFWETLKGATPALAPGMLIFLGCLGLVCTYQHPALAASGPTNEPAGN